MSTGDSSQYQPLLALRERMNWDAVFESALDEFSGKMDFKWVKSCVAIGCGFGKYELSFARRFLPNLKTFVAVEPDHVAQMVLRASIQVMLFLFIIMFCCSRFSFFSQRVISNVPQPIVTKLSHIIESECTCNLARSFSCPAPLKFGV